METEYAMPGRLVLRDTFGDVHSVTVVVVVGPAGVTWRDEPDLHDRIRAIIALRGDRVPTSPLSPGLE